MGFNFRPLTKIVENLKREKHKFRKEHEFQIGRNFALTSAELMPDYIIIWNSNLNMDLRVKKTKSAIINSFLELRSKKPLERITVKELSDFAQINKATFYLHYKDIYDLSESLEEELLDNVLDRISHPNAVLSEPKVFIRELIDGFVANQTLIDIIFSWRSQC